MTKNDALPFPTILLIDSAEREHSAVALLQSGREPRVVGRGVRAQELPSMIGELLEAAGILPAQVKAVALVKRGGSVTAIRIGTAAANTFAWLNRLTILEVEAATIEEAAGLLAAGKYTAAVKNSLPTA